MDQEKKSPRIRDLFVWQAQSRPRHSYSWEVFATLGAIAVLTSIIFSFFQEWLAILVIWAAFFLFYALTKYPPTEVTHKITTEGLITFIGPEVGAFGAGEGKVHIWAQLGPFWFTTRTGETTLHVASSNIFEHVAILVNDMDIEKIKETLAEYLPFIEVPEKSPTDRLTDWLSDKIILEKHRKPA